MHVAATIVTTLALAGTAAAQPVAPAVTDVDVCSGRRQVAFLAAGAPCQTPLANWVASPLIPAAEQGTLPAGAQAHFGRYCVFDFTPQGLPTAAQVNALHGTVAGDIAPDCEAVAGMGSPATDAAWPEVQARFRHGIDALDVVPDTGAQATRVAVIDSSPFEFGSGPRALANEGRSGHGFTMGRIVRDIACPDPTAGACLALVADHPALIMLPDGSRDRFNGGYFGALTDLARALSVTLHEHEQVVGHLGHRNLVVNLSLGWAPDLAASDPTLLGDVPNPALAAPAVRAVFDLIQLASCQGHLVVAAAGNHINGPEAGSGPLLPGGWEQEPLSAGACGRFGLSRPGASTGYRPSLYSVGGIGTDDQPLINARTGAEPRQVTFASHGVAAAADPALSPADAALKPGATEVYTGSSVAAAVVSGTAALAWGFRPGLSAADLMDQVWRSGTSVGRVADYCSTPFGSSACGLSPASPARRVRRISVRAAACFVCALGMGSCPSLPALQCGLTPAAPAPVQIDDALITHHLGDFGAPHDVPDPAVCQPDDVQEHSTLGGGEPCNDRQFRSPNASPRVGPQPFDPLCPTCLMIDTTGLASYTVKGVLNTSYSGYQMENVTLKLGNGVSVSLDSFLKAGGVTSLYGGDSFSVTGVDLSSTSAFKSATIHATIVEKGVKYVIDSPVLVY